MTGSAEIEDALAEVATRPPEAWQRMLRLRFPHDETLVRHALIWLHAERTRSAAAEQPVLGPSGERFRLETLLDRGATASVWQAHDRKLGRTVALKIFHDERSGELDNVLAEARSACEVVSDHVVRIYDVPDDDPPYLVMELVGEHDPARGTLVPAMSAARCRPRDLREAVRWSRDVARGVHDAHLRNVFHRDLKPQNVLITPCSRRAKVADFGLAIGTHGTVDTAGLLFTTADGPARISGTPEMMAPEQARGLPVALDPRDPADRATLVAVDVWGLGAVALALITGAPPWPAAAADDEEDAWETAASGAPPRIATHALPRRLRRILERALALDPSARYASAAELAAELDAYLERRPTSRDRGPGVRAWLWSRRNPQLSASVLVAVVLGATLSATYAAVLRLRDERAALAIDKRDLRAAVASAQEELDATERELAEQGESLANLERVLLAAREEYRGILAVKESALRTADRATQQLADQLANARSDRDVAETARDMYERFWTRARAHAKQLTEDLERAELERDALRAERDRAIKDRDSARAARARTEQERDRAEAEREAAVAARRRLEIDVANLMGTVAAHADVAADP